MMLAALQDKIHLSNKSFPGTDPQPKNIHLFIINLARFHFVSLAETQINIVAYYLIQYLELNSNHCSDLVLNG